MDAVTYPQPEVVSALNEGFALFKVNMLERHPEFKAASGAGRVMWGPTFVFSDARGNEVRRFVGWLPPKSFLGELAFVRATAAFNRGKFPDALEGFSSVVADYAGTEIYPEALYWKGIAGFMAGKLDWDALRASWGKLASDFPGTRWGTHASVIEDA